MKPEIFKQELLKIGIELSDKQMNQFKTYYELLVEWNEKINLTAITELEEVYLKHFYDSITLAVSMDLKDKAYSICDVGAGAGFPSIPLKIVFPELKVSIVDSLNKRIKFLNLLAEALELDNVHFYHDRAETFGQNKAHRENFDIVTARAVARLNVLAELCIPLVKKGGHFVALKAAKSEEEVTEAKNAIATLGGKLISEQEVSLPFSEDKRYIVTIEKKKETPNKYPRKPGTPNKKPLV